MLQKALFRLVSNVLRVIMRSPILWQHECLYFSITTPGPPLRITGNPMRYTSILLCNWDSRAFAALSFGFLRRLSSSTFKLNIYPFQNAGDNWTGANNPFGPKIPLGAHGQNGSAPPGRGGWSSGECNFNGQAQCGQVCDKLPAEMFVII